MILINFTPRITHHLIHGIKFCFGMCNSFIHYYKGISIAGLSKRLRVAGEMGDFLILVFFFMVVKLSYIRSDIFIRVDSGMVYCDNGEGWRSGES